MRRLLTICGSVGVAAALPALALAGDPVIQPESAATVPVEGELRIEISLSERELYEYRGGERVNTFPVAVGQQDHETVTGEWGIHEVVWNPEWIPPDSEWAEDFDRKDPGHPDNPLGQAQMIFKAPYSIHGTDDLESLGEAASHGSIRMANDDIIGLAQRVMEAGGAERSDAWVEEALADPGDLRSVGLPDPVPIVIRD